MKFKKNFFKTIQTPRKSKMETPDMQKISSRQSLSKFKELPPIKSGKENYYNIEQNTYREETPWNLNSTSQRSFSRIYNPEMNDQSQVIKKN